MVVDFRNLYVPYGIRFSISGPEPCWDYAMYIYIYMVGTCGLKTLGMLACTTGMYCVLGFVRQINYGSGCGRKDMGPYTVSGVVWALIDQYTTGLIGAGPIRQRRR